MINGGEKVVLVAAEWVDDVVQSYLTGRKRINKKWRVARRNKQPKEILDKLEEDYKIQQKETLRIIGMKKGTWEMKKIAQAKNIVK